MIDREEYIPVHHILSLPVLSVKDQLTDLIQSTLPDVRVGIGVGLAGPYGLFIELEAVKCRDSEDHSPQPSVTYRKGFHPFIGRFIIPELKVVVKRSGFTTGNCSQSHQKSQYRSHNLCIDICKYMILQIRRCLLLFQIL